MDLGVGWIWRSERKGKGGWGVLKIKRKEEKLKRERGRRKETSKPTHTLAKGAPLTCHPFPLPDMRGLYFHIQLDTNHDLTLSQERDLSLYHGALPFQRQRFYVLLRKGPVSHHQKAPLTFPSFLLNIGLRLGWDS